MKLLKQSTASTVVVGPVLDANGAAVTTAVVGDFKLAKNGTTATLSGATVTHDANGYYTIALTTGNTDTVGRLAIYSGNTAQSMATHHWTVLLASVFDAILTNATNTTGGLATATAAISAFAGAISTYAGGAVASVTGNVGGNVVGSVGSIAGVTFPTNFGSLLINVSGHVSRVVLVDTTTTNTDMRGTDNAALASNWTPTRAGYLDSVLLAQNSNQRTVQVTGSNHVAADVHEMQTDVIDSDAIAASAVTELQSGLATAANLLIVSDRVSYSLAVLVGACSDAQTAAETYTLSIGGNTFTVDYSGLDASGNRSTTTLSKA